jgi:hypothetical protein
MCANPVHRSEREIKRERKREREREKEEFCVFFE